MKIGSKIRKKILGLLRVRYHEELFDWLKENPEVFKAKEAFYMAFRGYKPGDDERPRLETAYSLAQSKNCSLNGFALRLVFYIELGNLIQLWNNSNA